MSKAGFKRMIRERRAAPVPRRPLPEPPLVQTRQPYTPPTDEQLANFVAAVVTGAAQADGLGIALSPAMAWLMLDANPIAKHGWLQRHREYQDAADRLACG